jgi:hypothetical protein
MLAVCIALGMVLRIDAENRAAARARPVVEPILRRHARSPLGSGQRVAREGRL